MFCWVCFCFGNSKVSMHVQSACICGLHACIVKICSNMTDITKTELCSSGRFLKDRERTESDKEVRRKGKQKIIMWICTRSSHSANSSRRFIKVSPIPICFFKLYRSLDTILKIVDSWESMSKRHSKAQNKQWQFSGVSQTVRRFVSWSFGRFVTRFFFRDQSHSVFIILGKPKGTLREPISKISVQSAIV